MSIDRKAAGRLENVLAMLGSPNDGERANAALMATRMLDQLGLDWRELVRRAVGGAKAEQSWRYWQDGSHEIDLYLKLLQWNGLADWERGFVLRNGAPIWTNFAYCGTKEGLLLRLPKGGHGCNPEAWAVIEALPDYFDSLNE